MTSAATRILTRIAELEYPTIEQFPDADDRRAAQHEYQEKVRDIEAGFGIELAEIYLDEISPSRRLEVGKLVYAQAWSRGHDSGYLAIENDYMELAEMALAIYKLATS